MSFRVGLSLGGGGSRGAYQVGVLKALDESGILRQIRHVSGTSIGAINTMMVMAKFSYEKMIETWEKIDNIDLYGNHFSKFRFNKIGMFSLQDIYEKLSEEIKLSEVRESKIQGYVTATKIKKGSMIDQVMLHRMEKEVFHLNQVEDPHKATLASASIPVLFGSTEIKGKSYIDGGAKDNCPIEPLINHGCNIIIAIPIDRISSFGKYKKHPILIIDLKTHTLFKKIPIDILSFHPEDVKEKALYGYHMGMKMIEKLKELKYLNPDLSWQTVSHFTWIKFDRKDQKIKEEVFNSC